MRYFTPAILAALMLGGCACTCNPEQNAEPETEPAVTRTSNIPLLKDIPLLGHLFETRPMEVYSKPGGDPGILKDIPILGPEFEEDQPVEE